jgi:bile acid:Na+ symporter, BASS family
MELLNKAVPLAMLAFVISSMLAMGLGLTIREIVTPLKNYSLVARALLANFVVIPFVAMALGRLLHLDEPLAVGLLLLGTSAGAPFLPKLAQLAKADLGFSVGLMVLLMVITIGYLPLVLPLMLPGVTVNSWAIARSLLLLMLLPLSLALVVNARFPAAAERAKGVLDRISSLSLVLLFVLLVVVHFTNVLAVLGTGGILAGLLFLVAGLGTGWVLGGPSRGTRQVLALGTAQRNIAAALVVAGQAFSDPNVVVMVVVVAIIGLVVLMGTARAIGNRGAEPSSVTAA